MTLAPARTSLALPTVVLMSTITLGFTESPWVAPTSGPDQSLKTLLDDNPRNIKGEAVSHNLPAARKGLAAGQTPFAAVIRGVDSRASSIRSASPAR